MCSKVVNIHITELSGNLNIPKWKVNMNHIIEEKYIFVNGSLKETIRMAFPDANYKHANVCNNLYTRFETHVYETLFEILSPSEYSFENINGFIIEFKLHDDVVNEIRKKKNSFVEYRKIKKVLSDLDNRVCIFRRIGKIVTEDKNDSFANKSIIILSKIERNNKFVNSNDGFVVPLSLLSTAKNLDEYLKVNFPNIPVYILYMYKYPDEAQLIFHVLDDDMDANNNSHFDYFLSAANSILQKIDIDDISKFLRNNLDRIKNAVLFQRIEKWIEAKNAELFNKRKELLNTREQLEAHLAECYHELMNVERTISYIGMKETTEKLINEIMIIEKMPQIKRVVVGENEIRVKTNHLYVVRPDTKDAIHIGCIDLIIPMDLGSNILAFRSIEQDIDVPYPVEYCHPNVYNSGKFCVSSYGNEHVKLRASYELAALILLYLKILLQCNPNSPTCDINSFYHTTVQEAVEMVKQVYGK